MQAIEVERGEVAGSLGLRTWVEISKGEGFGFAHWDAVQDHRSLRAGLRGAEGEVLPEGSSGLKFGLRSHSYKDVEDFGAFDRVKRLNSTELGQGVTVKIALLGRRSAGRRSSCTCGLWSCLKVGYRSP